MSPSAERRRAPDEGFSMLEVLVAIAIISVVMIALLPQLIIGIKATGTAGLITQAKGSSQGQLERMRNLPFHVSPSAGDYRDVLDFYFRNLTAPAINPVCKTGGEYAVPATGWTGYVAAGGARCDYEPASGPMYRYITPVNAEGFVLVVSTQFLSGATPPTAVTPISGYNTQTTGKASPPASQIGVTVTAVHVDGGSRRPVSTYTQFASQPTVEQRIKASATATAVEVGSITSANGPVTMAAGMLSLTGALTYASTANATLAGTTAALATGEEGSGAAATLAAPPARAGAITVDGAGGLQSGCGLVCWGGTQVDLGAMTSEDGLPNVGSQSAPMQALLRDLLNDGFSFQNSAAPDYRASLLLTGPLLTVDPSATAGGSGMATNCTQTGAGPSSYVAASGFLRSTDVADPSSPSSVVSCALTRASSISLFPTAFAPRGVILVELQRAGARCSMAGAAHVPTTSYDYRAVVKYHAASPDPDAYVTAVEIVPGLSADPLDDLPMSTPVGGGKTLGDYVESWSALVDSELVTTQADGKAAVTIPGVLTLASRPVRMGSGVLTAPTSTPDEGVDVSSAVAATFGAVSCSAEDAR